MTEREDTQTPSLLGQVLSDRYRIDRLLGEGGMGAVYLGEHQLMHKRVAIKVLHPEMMLISEVVQRFEREALAAAHIDHPNVAAATDFGRTPDGAFFLVLEFLEGKSLRDTLDGGAMPAEQVLHIGQQVANALAKAHSRGIVHRDLKPENIMLIERDGDPSFVKVLDFGIAKVPVDELAGQSITVAQGLTRLGVMYGTPEYMAPEQALGQQIDFRVDLYALGVVLYELLCGQRPFNSDSIVGIVTAHVTAKPPPLAERVAGLHPGVEAMVMRLLEKQPDKRQGSARELADELLKLRQLLGDPSAAPRSSQIYAPPYSPAPPSASHPSLSAAANLPTALASVALVTSPEPPAAARSEQAQTFLPTAEPAAALATQVQDAPATQQSALAPLQPAAALAQLESKLPSEVRELLGAIQKTLGLKDSQRLFPLFACAAVAALIALSVVGFAISHIGGSSTNSETAALTPPTAEKPAAPRSKLASAEELSNAAAAGTSALETLSGQYPYDPAVMKTLLLAQAESKRLVDAMGTLSKLASISPNVAQEDSVRAVIKAAAEGPPEAATQAFLLLEGQLGEAGIDYLYDLWTTKEASSKVQERAGKSLARTEVREKAAQPLQLLIELKSATTCEAKKKLLARARDMGDKRAAKLLSPLNHRRGCGFAGIADCWSCLRSDSQLSDALKAIDAREKGETTPTAPASARP